MKKRIINLLICFIAFLSFLPYNTVCAVGDTKNDVLSIADGIIRWKKVDNGSSADGYLINETFLELAGTTPGDWFPIGLGRLGIDDNYSGYLAVIKDCIEDRYSQSGKLSAAKATEWHRISLAVLAMGGDPTDIGTDENGNKINLIADGVYDRGKTTPLGRQGINGWIWGLITLDSMRYEVPEGAYYTRDSIITEIIRQQLADGGFALSGKSADPDITAMALQSLAPYYNSEKSYSYVQRVTKTKVTKTVRQVVDEALKCLSELQLDTGDFASWGTENVESTDQVVVALCSLGINPLTDERFIKNGNTLLDGILRYQMDDGGFIHSFTYDPDNPTSLPDKSNTMASEQTLYTMAAIWRQTNGMRTLYDFREEQSISLKQRILNIENQISSISSKTDKSTLEKLLSEFYSLPENERSYVHNYWHLSDYAKKKGLAINSIADNTSIIESPKDDQNDTVLLYFSESDKKIVDNLPEKLSTEYYVTVTTLLDKLNKSEVFDNMDVYLEKLTDAKKKIADIQKEIDEINSAIKEKLYPFESMNIADKIIVDKIVKRYESLSDYDKSKIERWEDVVKTKTKIDNILRGIIIAVVLTVITAVLVVLLVRSIKSKCLKKKLEMEELASLYENEE